MKVLITGACGLVGSHATERFLGQGDEVLGIENFCTGRREHLPESHERLTLIDGSIADRDLIDQAFGSFRPDVVVHTAATYKDPDDWYSDTLTNTVGGANVIRASAKHGVGRFIYFQTALCYGVKPEENPITLNHPRRPANSSYAITKSAAEDFLEISGLNWVTFRLANISGPRGVSGPLPIFYQRIKDGKRCFVTPARRDFVFVDDLIDVVVRAAEGTGSGTYHFSTGKDVPIRELYDLVIKVMGKSDHPEPELKPLQSDDAPSILLDPARTFEDFGELSFTPLERVVEKAVDYFETYGTQGEYTHLKVNKGD